MWVSIRGPAFSCADGDEWSDPVSYTLTETSAGTQLGVQSSHLFVLLAVMLILGMIVYRFVLAR